MNVGHVVIEAILEKTAIKDHKAALVLLDRRVTAAKVDRKASK